MRSVPTGGMALKSLISAKAGSHDRYTLCPISHTDPANNVRSSALTGNPRSENVQADRWDTQSGKESSPRSNEQGPLASGRRAAREKLEDTNDEDFTRRCRPARHCRHCIDGIAADRTGAG